VKNHAKVLLFYDIQKFSSINFVACNINMEVLPPFLTKLLLIYKV